jgi:hypothetical protein
VVGLSVLAGLLLAIFWSAQLVDDDIGVNTANGLLGQDAGAANLTGTISGLVFAFVAGIAGTFTACNIAVFSAIAPLADTRRSARSRARTASAAALLVGGTFTFLYWAVRVPANFGFGWFPGAPWH